MRQSRPNFLGLFRFLLYGSTVLTSLARRIKHWVYGEAVLNSTEYVFCTSCVLVLHRNWSLFLFLIFKINFKSSLNRRKLAHPFSVIRQTLRDPSVDVHDLLSAGGRLTLQSLSPSLFFFCGFVHINPLFVTLCLLCPDLFSTWLG